MVLISLLGVHDSSIFPILFEFKDKISKHIIIHDDSRFEVNKIKKIQESEDNFKEFYSLKFETFSIKIDEDLYKCMDYAYSKIVDISNKKFENIYFNATDGLASSAIILSHKLLDKGAKFIAYDMFDNGYNIITKDSMKNKVISQNKDIYTHLMLKGYEIVHMGSKIEAYKRKDTIMKICENLSLYQEFANQVQSRRMDEIEGFYEIKNLLEKIDKLNDRMFIQGTLFEEYIYWLLVDNFNFDQVMFNVKVEFEPLFQNEFDILMIKDNHLHVIECKLRKFIPGENYVYKLDTVINYLDDDGKGMILLVGAEEQRVTDYGNVKVSFTRGTKARAKASNILLHQVKEFDKNRFLNDIKKHFLA